MADDLQNDFEKQRETIHRNMLSSVSHDLKTPLASVIGSLEIYERMKDKLSQDKKETLIATALQEAYRLDNFVTNILEMAKLENGMVKVNPEACHIGNLISDSLIKLGHRLKNSSVNVTAPDGDIIVETDPSLLSRATLQVLDNAVKYGGSPNVITINYGLNDAKDACIIRLQDNGRGIPIGQHEAVFHKYTRFAKLDQQTAGTGLGLSITKEIMRLLKGSIVADELPGGATFTITLPLK